MADLGWMSGLCHPERPGLDAPATMLLGGRKVAVAVDGVILAAVYADDSPFPAPTWAPEADELITTMLSARVEGVGVSLTALRNWCGAYVPMSSCERPAPGAFMPWWRPGLIDGRPVNRNMIARGLAHLEGGVGRIAWHSVVGADQEEYPALYIDRPTFWRLIVLGLAPTYGRAGVEPAVWEGEVANV